MDINQKYTDLLKKQIESIKKECRYLEFKSNYQEVDKLGRYISAMSNGACLDHQDYAYLYFGVDDDTLEVKGTTFDSSKVKAQGNEALELYLRRMVVPKVNFSIVEFMYEQEKRVVMFKIPAAVNEPTTYKQKPYIRVDSHVTDLTPKRYRNPFLAKAMDNVKMIDSKGYGIHNMFVRQKERYLPMPDYDESDDSHVIMHLPGTVMDEKYSLMLMENSDIGLTEAVLLDQVQRGKLINDNAIDLLRKKHLIEGRKPHLFVAKELAKNTGKKVEYSKHKGLEAKSCESLLLNTLKEHGILSRTEIDALLWNVVSDQLDDKQKKSKIGNILTNLRKRNLIENKTLGNISKWSLVKTEK